MKKYFGAFFITALIVSIYGVAFADDGGMMPYFDLVDKKTTCISVSNVDILGSNSMAIFDYSVKTGEAKGKPWTKVESGKCYELVDGTEDIYVLKNLSEEEKNLILNYKLYKPSDNFKIAFCGDDQCASNNKITAKIYPAGLMDNWDIDNYHSTGIVTYDLFNNKYDLGVPISSYSIMYGAPKLYDLVINDPLYVEAGKVYTELAKKLTDTISTCDSRARVEYRDYFSNSSEFESYYLNLNKVIWKLADNKEIIQTDWSEYSKINQLDDLTKIELMGCKQAYIDFLNENKSSFDKVDENIDKLIKKYPETLTNDKFIETKAFTLSSKDKLDKIQSFIKGSLKSADPVVVASSDSTTLDDPTTEKKINNVLNSPNKLMKAYVFLPLVAIIGLAVILYKKRK